MSWEHIEEWYAVKLSPQAIENHKKWDPNFSERWTIVESIINPITPDDPPEIVLYELMFPKSSDVRHLAERIHDTWYEVFSIVVSPQKKPDGTNRFVIVGEAEEFPHSFKR